MRNSHLYLSYFLHWLNLVDEHSLHAPYIYELYTTIIKIEDSSHDFYEIEKVRNNFKESDSIIEVEDFGAGSVRLSGNIRKVSDIANYGITRKKFSRLLVRLIEFLDARNIVELGTSLGINTLYLSSPQNVMVNTFEGSKQLCNIAHEVFKGMKRDNVNVIEGNINSTLLEFTMASQSIDLAYIDANHKYNPTIEYFELLLNKSHKKTCIVIDDIHLSKEMSSAWKYIQNHHEVTLSLDLFYVGIIFVDPEMMKQHYVLSL